jgi:lysophospholipase L1-like esterase
MIGKRWDRNSGLVLGLVVTLALAWAGAALAQNTAIQPEPREGEKDDWWMKRHQSMNERVKQGNVDLILIGDSITHGWEGAGKEVWEKYYADRNAVNLGISGDRTQHVLWRLDNGNIAGINPKLAVIMIGTNNHQANTAPEIVEGITAIVQKLRQQLPQTKILLLAIFPRADRPQEIRDKLAEVNREIAKLADREMVHFRDIGKVFLDADGNLPKSIMPDLLHPGTEGYRRWAAAIEPDVARLLGEIDAGKAPKGFVPLFNGKDLTGWKGLVEDPEKRAKMSPEELAAAQAKADASMREHWKVVDGVLEFDGKGESLCTARDYEDFEMLVDWKITPDGDSGIYLRGTPQVQIWDPAHWKIGSGGLYNNEKNPKDALVIADNPIGEWNTFRIRMIGEKVDVWLNDQLVVDNVTLENFWDRSKPIYPSGQIELQSHKTPLWFKNVYIREIPRGEGWVDLFNGQDLDGWEQVGGNAPSWHVENGVLFTDGGEGGWLSTTKQYADFELELEYRVPENGNSGLFIRAPREGNPAFEGSEVQILDDFGSEYVDLKPWQFTGSVYATVAPSHRATRPAGEWQKLQVRAVGPQVSVKVNTVPVVDANLNDHLDKIAEHPGLKRTEGYIGLQNHSTRVDFRNLRIRELNPDGSPKTQE